MLKRSPSEYRVALFGEGEDVVVDHAHDTEEDDTGYGDYQAKSLCGARLEGRNFALVFGVDIHRLNYEEIVVEGNDGVDQRYQYEDVNGYRTLIDR